MQIENGRYTVVYKGGDYRTLRFAESKNPAFAGKVIASFKRGTEYVGFGFLLADNQIRFWKNFCTTNDAKRLKRIQHAVDIISRDPRAAQMAFAQREGACARCGRELTVPASLHAGLGPECAGKVRWNKQDQTKVFEWLKAEAQPA